MENTDTPTVWETDWLGSEPVYYNERTGAVSKNFLDVIDRSSIELDPEGFNNYLEFGYSVFEQTPFAHIKYLKHSSQLTQTSAGGLRVVSLPDVAENYIDQTTDEDTVWQRIEHAVRNIEMTYPHELILPLSGGFDSRILCYFLSERSRAKAFTYGTSEQQHLSFEVINARSLAQKVGVPWQQVPLHNFFSYVDRWENMYGAAIHAHGMYQLEFYEYIKNHVSSQAHVISGLIGDIWAGTLWVPDLSSPHDLSKLGYTHGLHADPTQSLLPKTNNLRNTYFSTQKTKLQNPRWRVVEAMRFKMSLLSFLVSTPKRLGLTASAPYILPQVALGMLTIDPTRRMNRQWQRDFFITHPETNVERHLIKDRKNTLNLKALRTQPPLPPLEVALLREFIRPDYLDWINTTLARAPRSLRLKKLLASPASLCYFFPGIHALPTRLGLDPYTLKCEESRALNAYLVLHPIQTVLKMRR